MSDERFIQTPTGFITMREPRLRDNPWFWMILAMNAVMALAVLWALENLR